MTLAIPLIALVVCLWFLRSERSKDRVEIAQIIDTLRIDAEFEDKRLEAMIGLLREERQHARQERNDLLNRIQAPEVAVATTLDVPGSPPAIGLDDDEGANRLVNAQRLANDVLEEELREMGIRS